MPSSVLLLWYLTVCFWNNYFYLLGKIWSTHSDSSLNEVNNIHLICNKTSFPIKLYTVSLIVTALIMADEKNGNYYILLNHTERLFRKTQLTTSFCYRQKQACYVVINCSLIKWIQNNFKTAKTNFFYTCFFVFLLYEKKVVLAQVFPNAHKIIEWSKSIINFDKSWKYQ